MVGPSLWRRAGAAALGALAGFFIGLTCLGFGCCVPVMAALGPGTNFNSDRVLEVMLWGYLLGVLAMTIAFAVIAWRGCVQTWFRRRSALCRGCGYNLMGNATGVCPECGRPIPPEQRNDLVIRE